MKKIVPFLLFLAGSTGHFCLQSREITDEEHMKIKSAFGNKGIPDHLTPKNTLWMLDVIMQQIAPTENDGIFSSFIKHFCIIAAAAYPLYFLYQFAR